MRRAGFTPPCPPTVVKGGVGVNPDLRALRRIAGAAESIGIAAVMVQAKDEAARAWYLGQAEWLEFPVGGRTLWMPVGWWDEKCESTPRQWMI
jgi:hypothetical protein